MKICFRVFTALLTVCLAATAAGCALAAGQEIMLPDGQSCLTLPGEMIYQAPTQEESDLKAIYLLEPELEMLVFSYDAQGMTVQSLAEALTGGGKDAQVRQIGEVQFLVFQDRDEADGASCIGYSYITPDQRMIEISFFYSTQSAMDLTVAIMESFHQ